MQSKNNKLFSGQPMVYFLSFFSVFVLNKVERCVATFKHQIDQRWNVLFVCGWDWIRAHWISRFRNRRGFPCVFYVSFLDTLWILIMTYTCVIFHSSRNTLSMLTISIGTHLDIDFDISILWIDQSVNQIESVTEYNIIECCTSKAFIEWPTVIVEQSKPH